MGSYDTYDLRPASIEFPVGSESRPGPHVFEVFFLWAERLLLFVKFMLKQLRNFINLNACLQKSGFWALF